MQRIQYNTFSTDRIEIEQLEIKGEKGHYVTGFITTDEVDLYKDKVTPEAMDGIIEQLKSGKIKLDIDHSNFTDDAPEIPIGKIIEAKKITDNGQVKIWIKGKLNDSHSRFTEVWKSIKDGFMDAFSIAFYTKDKATEIIDGAETKIIKAVDILNVAITGNPINRGATMEKAFYKSLHGDSLGEHTYEDIKSRINETETRLSERINNLEGRISVAKESSDKSVIGIKSSTESDDDKITNEGKQMAEEEAKKPEETAVEKTEESKAEDNTNETPEQEEKSLKEITELKSVVEEQKKAIDSQKEEMAELKAKLEKPVLKGLQKETTKKAEVESVDEETSRNVLQFC